MNNLRKIFIFIFVGVLFSFAGCFGDDSPSTKISFTIAEDAYTYSWSAGYYGTATDTGGVAVESSAQAWYSTDGSELMISAMPAACDIGDYLDDPTNNIPANYIYMQAPDVYTTGDYNLTYANGDYVELVLDDISYQILSGVDSISLTITAYGDAGGYLEGTFSGTLTNPDDTTDYITITNGVIKARVLVDDAIVW